MLVATISMGAHQAIAYNKSADDAQPTHQGVGRIGTAIENTLTLHPGNAVNALATGDQSDTTYGWHKDDKGRVKANRAHTNHNNNKSAIDRAEYRSQDHSKQSHKRLYKKDKENLSNGKEEHVDSISYETSSDAHPTRTKGHWFWKKEVNDKGETVENQETAENQKPVKIQKTVRNARDVF